MDSKFFLILFSLIAISQAFWISAERIDSDLTKRQPGYYGDGNGDGDDDFVKRQYYHDKDADLAKRQYYVHSEEDDDSKTGIKPIEEDYNRDRRQKNRGAVRKIIWF